MKLYKFYELGTKAKIKACNDYINGWLETHPDDNLSLEEASELIKDNEELFTKEGEYYE